MNEILRQRVEKPTLVVPEIESEPFLEFASRHPFFWTGTPVEKPNREQLGGLFRGVEDYRYSLKECFYRTNQRGVGAAKEIGDLFFQDTLLENFYFQILFRKDFRGKTEQRGDIAEVLKKSDAILLLIGGWGSCAEVWQALPDYLLACCPKLVVMAIDTPPFNRSKLKGNLSEEQKEFAYSTLWSNQIIFNALLPVLGLRSGDLANKPFGQGGHSRGGKALIQQGQTKLLDKNTATILLQPAANQEERYLALAALIGTAEIPAIGGAVELAQQKVFAKPIIDGLIPGATKGVKNLHLASFRNTGSQTIARTIHDLWQHGTDTSGFTESMQTANVWAVISRADRLVTFNEIKSLLLEQIHLSPEKLTETEGDHYSWVIERTRESVHNSEQQRRMRQVGDVIINALLRTSELEGRDDFIVEQSRMLTQLQVR